MKRRRPKRRKPQPDKRPSTELPPMGWLTIEQPRPTRRPINPSSQIVEPILPPREPTDQARFKAEVGGWAEASVGKAWQLEGGASKSVIESRLTEQPVAIRNTARALSKEFKSQATELKQQRPNDPDRIAQRENLVVLFENMATGLANLADNIDQAIVKASEDKPEPVFLGKAAEVVQQLHFEFMTWLKENGTAVFDVSFRVGIFLTGAVFLHSLGADSVTAVGALGYILKSLLSKKKGRKR